MKLKFYQNALKWSAATLSAATMVFSPVALGKEAENLTRAQITSALHDLGLQRQTTVGEFWDKIKDDVPGYMYQDFEGLVKQNRNMLMPEVSVSSVKGVYGEEVPVVRLSQNGKTDTIQFFGEKEKFIKFNGVTLTERDVQRMRDAEAKIEASDYKLKRESDQYKEQFIRSSSVSQNAKDFARFRGFPRMTPQLWKSLTPQKRARYIVTMRTLWLDARRVQAAFKRKPASIKKSNSKKSAAYSEGLELIFGQQAFADVTPQRVITADRSRAGSLRRPADVAGAQPPPPPPSAGSGDASVADVGAVSAGSQQYCIAAGYIVAQIGQGDNVNGRNRTLCDVRQALNNPRYQAADMNFIAQDNQTCKTQNNNSDNFVACNPVIYGYDRSSGGPICVDRMSQAMQDATTYPGACDTASRLTTSTDNIDITADEATRIGQIEDNQMADPNGAYKLSENYLDSVLKHRHNGQGLQALVKDGAWTADIDTELLNIQKKFEDDIRDGINYCDQNHSNGSSIYSVDRNQQAACDQLHRRWLFTEKFISEYRVKACPEGTHYVGTYAAGEKVSTATQKTSYNKMASNSELCECDSGAAAPPVDSGSAPPPDASSSAPPPPVSALATASPIRVALGSTSASCGGSVTPPPPPSSVTPPPPPSGPTPPASEDHSGGFPLWAKIGLGLLAVGGILCLTHTLICKKKKKDDPPGVCVAPKAGTYPNCACANTCTVGTLNPNSCSCDVVPPPVCPIPAQTRNAQGVCVCDTSVCASGTTQDPVTCQCSSIPLCPGTTTPVPSGGVANCPPPACPDNQPRQNGNCPTNCGSGVYVYAPNTCPVPNEGGSGNSCTNPPCSGGVPTSVGH